MAVPLLTKKIVKKRVKQFKRPQSDRKISVKVLFVSENSDSLFCFMFFVKSFWFFFFYSKVWKFDGFFGSFSRFGFLGSFYLFCFLDYFQFCFLKTGFHGENDDCLLSPQSYLHHQDAGWWLTCYLIPTT